MSRLQPPDGRTLASGGDDNTLRLWDPATGQPRGTPLTGHTDWVRCLAFSPDGRTLASGSDDHTLRLWDMRIYLNLCPQKMAQLGEKALLTGCDVTGATGLTPRQWESLKQAGIQGKPGAFVDSPTPSPRSSASSAGAPVFEKPLRTEPSSAPLPFDALTLTPGVPLSRWVNRQILKEAIRNPHLELVEGRAMGLGDCFFDAFAQTLNQLRGTHHTAKDLRRLCLELSSKHPAQIAALLRDNPRHLGKETQYSAIQFMVHERRDKPPIWGNHLVEGRLLTQHFGVILHVVEYQLEALAQQAPVGHQLVYPDGTAPLVEGESVPYENRNVIHLAVGANHYVPLLRR